MAHKDVHLATVIVPRTTSTRDIAALETAMQGLALDAHHPVALELAASATSRQFLLRTTSVMAQKHLEDQIRARYPQALIQPVAQQDDPLPLQPGEIVSAIELQPGAAAYLPLRSWKGHDLEQAGADPLLGILAVLNHLPAHTRVVSQLALIPASPTWSRSYRRKTVEHPLEQERLQARRELSSSVAGAGPGNRQLVGMGILVALLLLWWRFQQWLHPLLPAWLLQASVSLWQGKLPALMPVHMTELVIGGIVVLVGFFGVAFAVLTINNRRGNATIYDMRLVDEKTARLAYRVRLRLFVLAPDEERGGDEMNATSLFPRRVWMSLHRFVACLHPPHRRITWQSLSAAYQHWRQAAARKRRQRQEHVDILDHVVAAYRQYHIAAGGYFIPRRLAQGKVHRLLLSRTGWIPAHCSGWTYDLRSSRHVLSISDVAALWHLPQAQDLADLPYVERGRARTFLVPAALTTGHGWRIGESIHAGHCAPVYVPEDCLRHNLLAIARTGKGKSTLFQHLAQAVLASRTDAPTTNNMSLAFIEPHGDGIHTLVGLIPAHERDNVVLVDLANTRYPVGINPLDMVGKDRDKAIDTLITIAEHLWATSYGPRTENILEYALKTLADANETLVKADPQQGPDRQYTLLDVVALLRLSSFRHAVMEQVTDSILIDWWQRYFEPMDARQQHEITSSVITKISKFASSRIARRILGQPRCTIELGEIIRTGKIFLVSTASGVVGTDIAELVGITLLGLFQTALAEQAHARPQERRRYLVLIDEFQVFRGANYQAMLAELRKYGGSFGLATQSLAYLDKLDRTLRATVFANIDHLFAFAMAGEDARLLHELDGIASDDITNLDDFQCYVKLSVGGRRLPVFSMHLDAPPPPDRDMARGIQLRSQQRDARPAGIVDEMLKQTLARQKQATPTKKPRAGTHGQTKLQEGGDMASQMDTDAPTTQAHRSRKRGNGGKKKEQAEDTTTHMHMMYRENDEKAQEETNEHTSRDSDA